ncbi:MAG TPA: FHA domain-containing protein, partial [Gemmataceae bacterium]|nr:FHA domain-containing protein [Gemmataceae bacterium]
LGPLNFSEPELSLPAATPIPSVPRPEVPAAPAALACPACGRSYGPEHRDAFCVCGAELTPAPVAVAPQPLPVKLPPTPERPSAGTPCLVLYGPDKRPVHYFPLTKDVLLIGRLDPVRGCFPDVDLSEWVDEATARKVSRRHALILRSRATNGFSLRPLPGNTGTQVNTNLLSAPEDVPLTAGTRIILGGTVRFKFETA